MYGYVFHSCFELLDITCYYDYACTFLAEKFCQAAAHALGASSDYNGLG